MTASSTYRRDDSAGLPAYSAVPVAAPHVIALNDVSLKFGAEPILSGVDLRIVRGQFICLLGPSGSGKSTLLRLIGGLLPAAPGTVLIEGSAPAAARTRLAFVFQSPRLAPWRTALGNVALGMTLRALHGRAERAQLAAEALALVGLAERADSYPAQLSGGQRQRVAIARALAVNPDIILMDEPFSALDPGTRSRLRNELIAIWQRTGKTIVFVTHDVEEALLLADRVVLLAGKPATVMDDIALRASRPRDLHSAEAVAARRRIATHFEPPSDTTHDHDPLNESQAA